METRKTKIQLEKMICILYKKKNSLGFCVLNFIVLYIIFE